MTATIPAFNVTIEDKDISILVTQRLISIRLLLTRGEEADQLDLTLDDSDGKLALPAKGVKISFLFGWKGKPLADAGLFTVTEVGHAGSPDTITIRARSANLIDTFKQQRDRSFHDTTLGAILDQIATGNDLRSGIAPSLRSIAVAHADQTHESDAALLRRLGKKYDAVATVKNDTLLFIPINQSRTVSGKPLPTVTIARSLGDQHNYLSSESDAYSGVRAFWFDDKHGMRRSVVAGQAGNSKRLRTTYATEADARTAAASEWQRLLRGLATFDMTLAIGDPAITPQSPVIVTGFKPEINATVWLAKSVEHSGSNNGFTTHVQFEIKTEPADTEQELQRDPDEGVTGVKGHWKDPARKKKQAGTEQAGKMDNPKLLKHLYATRQSATHAVKHEWSKIQEVREIIAENND